MITGYGDATPAIESLKMGAEKRYVQLFNESPAFITILDENLRVVESNNRFKDQFGDEPDMYCFQVQQQRTIPCNTCPVKKTFADGRSHTAEMVHISSISHGIKGMLTGLGLFVARRSVQQHQGEIHVDSEPGKFTEFTIALPKKSI